MYEAKVINLTAVQLRMALADLRSTGVRFASILPGLRYRHNPQPLCLTRCPLGIQNPDFAAEALVRLYGLREARANRRRGGDRKIVFSQHFRLGREPGN
jgi:hypothetical protein